MRRSDRGRRSISGSSRMAGMRRRCYGLEECTPWMRGSRPTVIGSVMPCPNDRARLRPRPCDVSRRPFLETRRAIASGASTPRWRGDGRELFYLSQDSSVIALPVEESGDVERVDRTRPVSDRRAGPLWCRRPTLRRRAERRAVSGEASSGLVSDSGGRELAGTIAEIDRTGVDPLLIRRRSLPDCYRVSPIRGL